MTDLQEASWDFYDVEDEPITISKITFDILLKEEDPANLIALYSFYYYTVKFNRTIPTINHVIKNLKWTRGRIRKTRKSLIELGLIKNKGVCI